MLHRSFYVDVTRSCHHDRCSAMWWSHQTQSLGASPHCMGLGIPDLRSRRSCGQTLGWGGPGVGSRCPCSSLSSAVMWHGEPRKHLIALYTGHFFCQSSLPLICCALHAEWHRQSSIIHSVFIALLLCHSLIMPATVMRSDNLRSEHSVHEICDGIPCRLSSITEYVPTCGVKAHCQYAGCGICREVMMPALGCSWALWASSWWAGLGHWTSWL